MASKRNENRQTEVKFYYWNPEIGGTPEVKTEKIAYTRSDAIAQKNLTEKYDGCMIQVLELVQEEIKRTVYNSQLVFEYMISEFEDEETANENATENQTVIPYTLFEYDGQVWMKNDENFYSEYVLDNSPVKFSITEQRAFVRMSAERLFDGECIGTYDVKRHEVKHFAIVPNDELHHCVKES